MPSKYDRDSKGYDQVPLLAHGGDSSDEDDLLGLQRNGPGRPNRVDKNGKSDKLLNHVQSELDSTINVMRSNLGKALNRGDKLEDLEAKSESFEMNAFNFKAGSTKLRQKLWWQNCKLKLIFVFIVVVVLLVIIIPIAVKKKSK